MTYPWETQPFTDDFEFEFDLEDAEDEDNEFEQHHAGTAGPPAWMRTLVPRLAKWAGSVPMPFLVGWVKVESDGDIKSHTSAREYGYFQIMPSESEMLKFDHERLRTDADYSVQCGLKVLHFYARIVMKRFAVAPSAPSFWALVKLHHGGMGDAKKILDDAKAHGVDLRSWTAIKAHVESNRAALLAKMKHDPRRLIANADKTLTQGARLWALWQATQMPSATAQPEMELASSGRDCNCAHEADELEWEDQKTDRPAVVEWDQLGPAEVAWLQAGLNRTITKKHPIAVDGKATPHLTDLIRQLQHDAPKGSSARHGHLSRLGIRKLIKAGSPPKPTATPLAVGIDWNRDTRKVISCLRTAKHAALSISFVIRYYSLNPNRPVPDSRRKNLSRGEADALAALNIRCVSVYEWGKADAIGYAHGRQNGIWAFGHAQKCGQPTGTPIYFAIDFAPTAAQQSEIKRYFEGVRDGLAAAAANPKINPDKRSYPIGVYGNRPSLDLCKAQGIVTWFWQSCSPLNPDGTNQFRWRGVNVHQVSCEDELCPKTCGRRNCPSASVDWNESDGNEGSWFPTPVVAAAKGKGAAQHEHELGFRERRRQRLWDAGYGEAEAGDGEAEEFFD